MPRKLELGDLSLQLPKLALKQLGDPALPTRLLATSLQKDVVIRKVPLDFTVGGSAAIDVFNAPDDKDPARLFTGKPPSRRSSSLKIKAPVGFVSGSAWLAYRTSAQVGAEGGFKAAKFGFAGQAEGNLSVLLHDYRRHGAEEVVVTSIADDLASARFAVSAADVRSLAPGEALAFEVNGKLGASVSLRWSDLFTSHIAALSELLPGGGELSLKTGASLRASFKVGIEDHFVVVFSRQHPGEIDVAIRKSDRDELAVRAAAKVTVRFADKALAEEVLGAALDALLGAPFAKVKAILERPLLERAGPAGLSGADRALVEHAIGRLGIEGGEGASLYTLRERLGRLEADVSKLLVDIAETKASMAVDFHYSRTRSEEALIEATLNEASLGKRFGAMHGAMLRGDFEGVLEDGSSSESDGVTLHRFLEQETIRTKRSWGVSLGFGDFFSVGGRARSSVKEVLRRDRRLDRSRYSFTNIRAYKGSWGKDSCEWKTTLAAKSSRWASGAAPSANELDYSLDMLLQYEERRLSRRDVGWLVDLGVTWGMLAASGAGAARRRLEQLGEGRESVEVSFHLNLGDLAFRAMLPLLAAEDAEGFGRALARAVPWIAGEAGRDGPRARQSLYGGLWRRYLEDPAMAPGRLARGASEAARAAGRSGLAGFERQMTHWWTAGSLAQENPDLRGRWAALRLGARRLHDAISSEGSYRELRGAAKLMSQGWEHAFHMRAIGICLSEALRGLPGSKGYLNRALRVEYDEGGERVVLNLATA